MLFSANLVMIAIKNFKISNIYAKTLVDSFLFPKKYFIGCNLSLTAAHNGKQFILFECFEFDLFFNIQNSESIHFFK